MNIIIRSKEQLVTETRIKGYRVKVTYKQMSDKDMENKKNSIGRVIAESIRKINRSESGK